MTGSALRWAAGILAAVGMGLAAAQAAAGEIEKPDGYPARAVEIVVPWGTGGGTDTMVRSMAPYLEQHLGVAIKVINKPGANSVAGLNYLLSQPADGYTLVAVTNDALANIAAGTTDQKAQDFAWIARVVADLEMIFARSDDDRFKSFDDYVAQAKADPGKLTMAVAGQGGIEMIAVSLLNAALGLEVKLVPFDKSAERYAAFLGGHVDLLLEEPSDMKPYLDEGKIRALVQMIESRPAAFAEVPTAPELGVDVTMGLWRGIAAKQGTPGEILDYLEAVVAQVVKEPAFIEAYVKKRNLDIRPGFQNQVDFEKTARKELAQMREALKALQ